MRTGMPEDDTVLAAIELAGRAPSVHNSRLWRWRIDDTALHLYADWTRHVPVTDPDGRDLAISCGATLHHLRVALAALGWGSVVHRLPHPYDLRHLASVTLYSRQPRSDDIALLAAIQNHRCDRRAYSSWPVPDQLIDELRESAATEGCALRLVTDRTGRAELLAAIVATDRAQREALAQPAVCSGRHAGHRVGVLAASGAVVHTGPEEDPLQPAETRSDPEAGVLLVVGTSADDVASRLRAGEAASAVLLRANSFQLASHMLTQPLDVRGIRAGTRRRVLGGELFPQIVLRLGWPHVTAEPLPTSPRPAVSAISEPLTP
ncbi:Acg family FMN-binding oxidoreductase [Allokutzneria oryzae]|uniref:Acg family FMN-binding oxidoreductase n=1 Tax=Allokutzneria oryzae TaxID=1378989 RepID=A0ABV6A383_9PSEU